MRMQLTHLYTTKLFNVIVVLMACMCYTTWVNEARACTPKRRVQEREESMQKSRKVHPFEKRLWLLEEALEHKMDKTDGEGLEERVSDLESNHEGLESKLEDVDFKLDDVEFKQEELSEKVEDHEGQLADAESRIDDLESEAL